MAAGLALMATGLVNAQAPAPAPAPAQGAHAAHPPGDLPGPIDNLGDLEQTGRMMFKMADTNNDGLVSQKEAIDAGNLMVGGFFFRADKNGDGVLSQEEAKEARDSLFAQQPLLRYVAMKGKAEAAKPEGGNATQSPVKAIGNLSTRTTTSRSRRPRSVRRCRRPCRACSRSPTPIATIS